MSHDAIIERREDEHGVCAVVTHADDTIWITPELLDHARDPDRERFTSDLEIDGDVISFGTPGEGLGRLAYRIVGEHYERGQYQVYVAERVSM